MQNETKTGNNQHYERAARLVRKRSKAHRPHTCRGGAYTDTERTGEGEMNIKEASSEGAAGEVIQPVMVHLEFEQLGHPQIELLNALDVLRRHYVHSQIGFESINNDDFTRALRYFAEVVENE